MGLPDLRTFMHAPCRFRLRGGREVYGVVWESIPRGEHGLTFASIGEYERARREPMRPMATIAMHPEEILWAERLAD